MSKPTRVSPHGELTSRRSDAQSSGVERRSIGGDADLWLDPLFANADNAALQVRALRRVPAAQGQALAARIGQVQGNQHVQRMVAAMRADDEDAASEEASTSEAEAAPSEASAPTEEAAPMETVPVEAASPQETGEAEGGSTPANPGGRGPGRMQHAGEDPYVVTGATLDAITGQLHQIDGFGAGTTAPIGLSGRLQPERQEDDTYRVEVTWVINGAMVQLPQWADYDEACPAAQAEWDRFMRQTRRHEQEEHVDEARDFAAELGEEDTVITGETVAVLQRNLAAKQRELAGRLQDIHDGCDHGVLIDAILHPDNGRCPVEDEEEAEAQAESVEAPEAEGEAPSAEVSEEEQAPE